MRAQRRAAPGCFGFTGAKGCCGSSSYRFWEKFKIDQLFAAVKLKRREKNVEFVASPLWSTINEQVEAMREAGISVIALPCRRTMRWCRHSFFLNPKPIIIMLAFVKAGFKVFRYSFGRPHQCFSITLKVILSLSDHYNIFTNDWLWIEVCQNTVLSKIDITMTTINKIDKTWIMHDLNLLLKIRHKEHKVGCLANNLCEK